MSLPEPQAEHAALEFEGVSVVRGGRLVWSTCSLEPEENSQLLTAFLAHRPAWRLEAQHESLPTPDGPIDGGFAARLRREG